MTTTFLKCIHKSHVGDRMVLKEKFRSASNLVILSDTEHRNIHSSLKNLMKLW
jgi:hypothetical protein